MKHHTWLALAAALLLGGCAGTASEFECNATTSDRCMTMEQANDMARSKTEGARGKPGAGASPALVELPAPSVTPLSVPTAVKPQLSVAPAPVSDFVAPAPTSAAKIGQQCAVQHIDRTGAQADIGLPRPVVIGDDARCAGIRRYWASTPTSC